MHISAVALTLCAAAPAAETPQEPGLTMIIAGPALMAAGIGLEAAAAYPIHQRSRGPCQACILTYLGGSVVTLGGGALIAGYSWQRGAWDAHRDLANDAVEESPYAVAGWVVAGLGVASKVIGLVRTTPVDYYSIPKEESARRFRDLFIIDAVSAPLLGAGAFLLGYSLGYDSVVDKRTRLAVIPSTRGIHIVGQF